MTHYDVAYLISSLMAGTCENAKRVIFLTMVEMLEQKKINFLQRFRRL